MAAELRRLAEPPPQDATERRELYDAARSLFQSLETPADAMHRIFWSSAQLPMTQLGVDLQIFRTLSKNAEAVLTVEQLATPTKADPALVSRITRYLSSFGLIEETGSATYRANATTKWLATTGGEGGTKHFYRTTTPIFQALPDVLRRQRYQNPTNPLDTAFQVAHDTTSHAYSWLPGDSSLLTAFFDYLKSQRQGVKKWTETFPTDTIQLTNEELQNGRALFVEVGGGTGPQCLNLRQTGIKGKIVLQDQPPVLAKANIEELSAADVQVMAHDFFSEQPIKRAKAYYMKNIMHDWGDDNCVKILKQLVPAMASDSIILIQDCVLPDSGASWKQTQMDIQMMAALAAVERTQSQWEILLDRAGLRIRDVFLHNKETGNSIIVAVPT